MSEVPSEERRLTEDSPSDAGVASESSALQKRSIPAVRVLRIWPAVLLLVSLWALRIIPGLYSEASMPVMMARFMGPLACGGLILLWWLFLSRATIMEKALGLLGLVIIVIITTLLADKTIRGFGTMIYAIPWGISGFTVALICLARMPSLRRTCLALLAAAPVA